MEQEICNFMPGPVNIHPDVKQTYHETFLSHRSEKFYSDVSSFRQRLCAFVNAQNVAFLVGSGSMGNEVVAQYLRQLGGRGLVLVNGEFGKRLSEQASHIDLNFDTLSWNLGEAFDIAEIEKFVDQNRPSWIWMVHCETSAGVLNDLAALKRISKQHHAKLAVDCISTIGNVPVNLEGVWIASGTSGKGLASYPGIAMVYYSDDVLQLKTSGVPKYMNLQHHEDNRHVPYTISTNLFYALVHAFNTVSVDGHQSNIKALGDRVANELEALGFQLLGKREHMMPGIVSIICPQGTSSFDLGVELEKNNFFVNFGGAYLRKGNYFQICFMGHVQKEKADALVGFLRNKIQTSKNEMRLAG